MEGGKNAAKGLRPDLSSGKKIVGRKVLQKKITLGRKIGEAKQLEERKKRGKAALHQVGEGESADSGEAEENQGNEPTPAHAGNYQTKNTANRPMSKEKNSTPEDEGALQSSSEPAKRKKQKNWEPQGSNVKSWHSTTGRGFLVSGRKGRPISK